MSLIYKRSLGRRLPVSHTSRTYLATFSHCYALPTIHLMPSSWRASFSTTTVHTSKLNLPALDEKWRAKWDRLRCLKSQHGKGTDATSRIKYILPMFPYPSGHLHIGHLRVYTVADVLARFHALLGEKTMLPMGWDSFGLPAENAALQRGIKPVICTRDNIAKMKEQLRVMNGSWDWDREISTCEPEFYKHTQKIFLLLHKAGLAYQAEAEVNYDPVDKTVLANEQVDGNGCSWRSGAKVEKRFLTQWFLKISEFRNSLLEDLEVLSKENAWPERVLAMQKNWLGKSQGALIKFPILAHGQDAHAAIEVFTTRPDTLFGVQYLALAATHPIVQRLAETDEELQAFLDTLPGLPQDSKIGYMLPKLRAINPLAFHEQTPHAAKESLPVYVAPYVLGDYGVGAVMGVPGHDLRDNSFWKEHNYDQPVRIVLAASENESTTVLMNEPFVEHGFMTANCGPFKGKSSQDSGEMLVKMLEAAELAKPVEKWRLRDWLVSRQRFWGTPIPMIHCDLCGAVPVPDAQLPVKLPEVDHHWAEGKCGNPLESATEWFNTSCPKCGGAAKRETDTMDTFVDSSWYYMRFVDPHNTKAPFSSEKASLLPVDIYIGELVSDGRTEAVHEPFARLITQGMVHGKTYIDSTNGRFLRPEEVDLRDPAKPRVLASGEFATISYEKMSKSKFNGVDPTEFIMKHGADATRAHILFQAPVSDVLNWDEDKIVGVTRWLGRIYDLVEGTDFPWPEVNESALSKSLMKVDEEDSAAAVLGQEQRDADAAIWRDVQRTIESVTGSNREVYSLNTVVSDLMSLTNTMIANGKAGSELRTAALSALVRMLAPISPAFSSECWSALGAKESLFSGAVRFPVPDGTLPFLKPRTQTCAVQVDGKLRVAVDIPRPPGEKTDEELKKWVVDRIFEAEGAAKLGDPDKIRSAKKTIVVQGGKIVNFVL